MMKVVRKMTLFMACEAVKIVTWFKVSPSQFDSLSHQTPLVVSTFMLTGMH